MRKEILVDGMHCSHCADAAKKVLSEIDGVKNVNIDLKKKLAVVDVDDVLDSILTDAINSVGFDVLNITEY